MKLNQDKPQQPDVRTAKTLGETTGEAVEETVSDGKPRKQR